MALDPELSKAIVAGSKIAFRAISDELTSEGAQMIEAMHEEMVKARASGDDRAAHEYERAIESEMKRADLVKQRGRRDAVIELLKVGGRFAGSVGAAVANSYVPGSGAIVQAAVEVATAPKE